ncbi:MAG: hypothetical protein HFG80_06080 [Eubacterium sp.]|nr:hypothetical protein [Eubacterium sp.]
MQRQCMLTTTDNPFDPFKQFTSWFLFDVEKGYNTCAYLGRIAKISEQLSDEENDNEVERAIDEIIKYDFMNIYRKVTRQNDAVSVDKVS